MTMNKRSQVSHSLNFFNFITWKNVRFYRILPWKNVNNYKKLPWKSVILVQFMSVFKIKIITLHPQIQLKCILLTF